MSRAREFLGLSTSDRLLLVVTGALFAVFSVTLHVGSLGTSEALARRLAGAGLARWPVERVDWALLVVESSSPGSGGCLPAALVGLSISEEPLELRIGVRHSDSSIEAHAWLESGDGERLSVGADPSTFRRLGGN
jgi:hypothetical protein